MPQKTDTLFLIIKEKYLNEILNGTKKIEYRDVNEYYINRFCTVNKAGEITGTKQDYKFIQFQAGYNKDSKKAKFICNGIFLTTYMHKIPEGMKKGDQLFEIEIGPQVK